MIMHVARMKKQW